MQHASVQIIGSPISPYVRKVLVCLEEKKIGYEIDPIVPFFGNDELLAPLAAAAHPGADRRSRRARATRR